MSNAQKIKIPRMPDRAVIECFKNLAKKHNVSAISVSALGFSQIGNIDLNAEGNADFETLLAHDSTLIDSTSMRISGLTITYARGGQYPPEQKSPIFDEIILNYNAQQGDLSNKDKLDIVAFINKELKAFEPGRFVETGLSQEQNQLLSIHESTLERLERLNEDLIKQSSEFRENLEKRFEEKTAELETQTKSKQDELDKKYEKRNAEVENKEKSLEEKLRSIDDRDNTHVRREIRDKMLNDVKDRIKDFGVSKNTERKRRPVFYGILIMIISLASMLVFTGYELSTVEKQYYSNLETLRNMSSWGDEKLKAAGVTSDLIAKVSVKDADRTNIYWLWAKITLLSIGLLGTILFYVRWQNKWAEQHSNSEFQLQQFYIDVNRANWVIESCLEWRKETESAIPRELIESITNNLFVTESSELEKVIHPADELASALMGSASKLKLKMGDSELEFDKPGKIAKTRKTSDKAEKST